MTSTKAIAKRVDDIIARAKTIVVTNEDEYKQAVEFTKAAKQTASFVKKEFEPLRLETYEAYKSVTDRIKRFVDVCDEAEKIGKRAMVDYMQRLEAERQEAEAKARKEAEERALAEAIQSGDDRILDAPLPVVEMPDQGPPKAEGVTYVDNWKAEVLDFMMLVKAVAAGEVASSVLKVDQSALNAMAKSMRQDAAIPGVSVYNDRQPRVKA